MNFESTLGRGTTSTLKLRNVILPSRWAFIAATPSINSSKILRFVMIALFSRYPCGLRLALGLPPVLFAEPAAPIPMG
jgi:hypothetical protein